MDLAEKYLKRAFVLKKKKKKGFKTTGLYGHQNRQGSKSSDYLILDSTE